MPTKAETARIDREAAIEELRLICPVGTTVRTNVNHVSKSGMVRDISLYLPLLDDDGKPYIRDITYLVARATGDKISPRNNGIRVGGCGMDMAFALVYELSRTLHPNGHPCTGERGCPSNEHVNDYNRLCREWADAHEGQEWSVGERQTWIGEQPTYDTSRVHSDGGYALHKSAL